MGKRKGYGIELHGHSYRYRIRVMKDGVARVDGYKRYPFVVGPQAKALAPDDPLRKENAYAQALAYAIHDQQARKRPVRVNAIKETIGSLMEWLVRYQVEALELRRYNVAFLGAHVERINAQIDKKPGEALPPDTVPDEKLRFHIEPRSDGGVAHDKSQIRSLFRMARENLEIKVLLEKEVAAIGSSDIHFLLAMWSGGKAKPRTKRRLINTLSSVWRHHAQFYEMKPPKPWADITIHGDGSAPKARAIKKAEMTRLEVEFSRLHPTVRGAIEFLRSTGARRSEAAKLRWEKILWPDTDGAAPSAHFERTKARRGQYRARFVYLDNECLVALARMLKPENDKGKPIAYDVAKFDWRKFDWPEQGWVFPAPTNPSKPLSGQTIYQAFVRSVQHAGIPHASPHHLRHTKATVLTAMVPQAMAQEMLGHEDAATFAIYRHLAEEAGYMVRDKQGALVNAEELKSKDDIAQAMKKLPKAERAALLAELLAD